MVSNQGRRRARMLFLFARVDIGGTGLSPADFALPDVSIKDMAHVVCPDTKIGPVPPGIKDEIGK